jgi:L-fuconolactonase
MLLDAHAHVWDLARVDYPWLGPELEVLHRSYGIAEVERELRAHGAGGVVLVQAANSRADTELMLAAREATSFVRGVVGWVDLTAGAAIEEEARELAARGVVGIRHLIHDEPDPDWLLQPAVDEGLAAIARAGLVFDVVSVLPRHLEHVPGMARRHPGLQLVVDHLSKPPLRRLEPEAWRRWAALLADAAACENVVAKLSGLSVEEPADWSADDLRPTVAHALDVLGPQRLLYGGDWPVSLLGGGYERQLAAVEELLAGLAPAELDAIQHRVAERVYGC